MRFSGLSMRLAVALIGIAAFTGLSTGLLAIRSSYRALAQQKQLDELAIARSIAAQVDEVVAKAGQTVSRLAKDPDVAASDRSRQRRALTLVAGVTELIDGLAIFDASGRLVAADATEPSTEELLPARGRTVWERPEAADGVWYPPVYRAASGELVAAIAAPLGGPSKGTLIGFILFKNHSLGGLDHIRIGKTGYAYLVDERANVLVHPQRERILASMAQHPPVRELMARGEGVTEFVNQDGVSVVAAFARVPSTGWGVVVRQPASESYAAARAMIASLVVALGACLAAAAWLGVWLARRIARPFAELSRGVKAIAEGRLDIRLPEQGDDDAARLAQGFNEMAGRLQSHLDELKQAHERRLTIERQLARSERLAAVGQLAAGVAHEINNPLAIISGFNELLLESTPASAPNRAHLEEISREAARCQRLVATLLDFAKPRSPQRRPTDLARLADEALTLLESSARGQKVDVQKELRPAPVTADEDLIKQAALNLMLNACQAMPEGGTLGVRVRAAGDSVELEVSDTGRGIPPEDLKRVFDPFFTTRPDGTGLGLPVTHAIVEQHGGTIALASRAGVGSTFTVRLPRTAADG